MKRKICASKLSIILAISFLLSLLVILKISTVTSYLGKLTAAAGPTAASSNIDLRYVLLSPFSKITLNLYDAESYEAAIVVQPLIGNLVYFSNKGRYEPRLAKSWQRIDSTTWELDLHEGMVCENGEEITAASFKQSLETSIKFRAKDSDVPVLNRLVGYEDFINGDAEIAGIKAQGTKLIFHFQTPTRTGVVQVLSFAPFGFICRENLNPDGSWKNNTKFISSGPFKVETVEIGTRYVLVRRPEWNLPFVKNAPTRVEISHQIPANFNPDFNWIIDRVREPEKLPSELELYSLVPEYLYGVFFGNLQKGYFSNIENRRYLKNLIEKYRDLVLPEQKLGWTRSHSMYPNLEPIVTVTEPQRVKPGHPNHELIIEGTEPKSGGLAYFVWPALKAALDAGQIPYRFAGNETTTTSKRDQHYDIRMGSPSVGGGVEAWGIAIKFCSKIGSNLPDPTGNICRLVKAYERDELNDENLTRSFLSQVNEDAAIVTLGHLGVRLYLSKSINKDSLSPALSIVRFDQVELE